MFHSLLDFKVMGFAILVQKKTSSDSHIFESGSYHIAHVDPKITILLPQSSKQLDPQACNDNAETVLSPSI